MPTLNAKLAKFSGGIGLSLNVKDNLKTAAINAASDVEDSFYVVKHLFPPSACGNDHVLTRMAGLIAKFRGRFKGSGSVSGKAKLVVCPSDLPGWYVVADEMVDKVWEEFNQMNTQLAELKVLCEAEYPRLIAKAREAHRDEFKEHQYPHSAEALLRGVYTDLAWMPMFSPDHIAGSFSREVLEKMREQAQGNANKVAQQSATEVFSELLRKVSSIADTFNNPDGRIVESTIQNLSEACDFATLKILAPEGSQERAAIEALVAGTKEKLSAIDVAQIRKHAGLRADAGAQLGLIASQFGELGKRTFNLE